MVLLMGFLLSPGRSCHCLASQFHCRGPDPSARLATGQNPTTGLELVADALEDVLGNDAQ
jgi:hypothetical protein